MKQATHDYYPEWNSLREKERFLFDRAAGGRLHMVLVFPQPYSLAMSNLGFQYIYRLACSLPDVECERAFYSPTGQPVSFESKRPLGDFDLITFSSSYALDYIPMLEMLLRSGISLDAKDSMNRPILAAGGVAITANPLPLTDFFDLFFIGDGEDTLPLAINNLLESKGREHWLDSLSEHAGFFIPGRSSLTVQAAAVNDFLSHQICSGILTSETEFSNCLLVESTRGCPYSCRFCLAKHIHERVQHRPMEAVWEMAQRDEVERVGLIGAGVSTHPQFVEMCEGLIARGKGVTASSLRLNNVSREMVETLVRGGQKTITIAPEAGDESTRKNILNKNSSDAEVLATTETVARAGARNIKLYFLTGIPGAGAGETDALIALVHKICDVFTSAGGGRGTITLGVAPFVPKPHTPWASEPMVDTAEARSAITAIRKAFKGERSLRFTSASPFESLTDGLFSTGDSTLGPALYKLASLASGERKKWVLANLQKEIGVLQSKRPPFSYVLKHGCEKE
jgi:radical SAM superfamily enzyme YgiQ (UPF0313 family)